jgi:AcrR family transcriptional regulator
MGAKKRSVYHHGDLAEALLEAAIREIGAHGTEKLSLRALAREAGVSPTAPYRHFESRTALFAALALRGFHALHERLRAADVGYGPADRLLRTSEAYIEFAQAHRVEYQLMFGDVIADLSEFDGLREAANACYAVPLAIIDEGIRAGEFLPAPAITHGAAIWTALHGVSSLLINFDARTEVHAPALESIRYLRSSYREVLTILLRGISVAPGDASAACLSDQLGDGVQDR